MGSEFDDESVDSDSLWNNPSFDFSRLKNCNWSVAEIFWMLLGDHGLYVIDDPRWNFALGIRQKTDFRITKIFKKFRNDLVSGRFGEFSGNAQDSDLFFHHIHPLKIIDWLKDQNILEQLRSFGYNIHPCLETLIDEWNKGRGENKKYLDGPNFERFSKNHGWALGQFRNLLFGEIYSRQISSTIYHKYNPEIEELMRDVDQCIKHGILSGRIRNPKGKFVGLNEPDVYSSQELLREIKFVGYPVPEGLIEARDKGDWPTVEKLLKKLHESMKNFVKSGGKLVTKRDPQAHPAPTTKRAKDKALKAKLRNIYNELNKKDSSLTYQDILNHSGFPLAIEDSGHVKSYSPPIKTIQNWLADFRKTN